MLGRACVSIKVRRLCCSLSLSLLSSLRGLYVRIGSGLSVSCGWETGFSASSLFPQAPALQIFMPLGICDSTLGLFQCRGGAVVHLLPSALELNERSQVSFCVCGLRGNSLLLSFAHRTPLRITVNGVG